MPPFIVRSALIGAIAILSASGAAAQESINPAQDAFASATEEDAAPPPKIVDRLPVELDDESLANALRVDVAPPATVIRLSRPGQTATATWNRVDNRDGSAKFSVTKSLPTPWDAKIGADISTAPPPPDVYEPRQLPGTSSNAGAGVAWANVAVPRFATVEVRAEPANAYDKFGTKLERTQPLGSSLSVTAQTTFGVTELRPSAAPALDGTRLFSTDNALQLNILPTGTSLAAGTSTVTGDPVTHSRLTAAQKIYGPLNVTGSIYDPGQPTTNMSITAGMNLAW